MLPSNYSVIDPTDLLRAAAERVMDIHDTTLGDGNPYVVRFRGRLRMDSIEAYRVDPIVKTRKWGQLRWGWPFSSQK